MLFDDRDWLGQPQPARIRAALLGEKDCYQHDRAVVDKLCAVHPQVEASAAWTQAFHGAAVCEFAGRGFDQFLEVGRGSAGNEHCLAVATGRHGRVRRS